METKNILTTAILANNPESEYDTKEFIWEENYPIHPCNFRIQDNEHLAEICSYTNSFLNEINFKVHISCLSCIINDHKELSTTQYIFNLHIGNHELLKEELKDLLSKTSRDFFQSQDSGILDTCSVHIIDDNYPGYHYRSSDEDPDYYATITLYNCY